MRGTPPTSVPPPGSPTARSSTGTPRLELQRRDEFSTKICQPLIAYVRERYGAPALAQIAAGANLEPTDLDKPVLWVSHEQVEEILRLAREIMESDEEFMQACSHGMQRSIGPLLLVLRATSPLRMFEIMARTLHFVCTVGRYEVLDGTHTSARIRYSSTKPDGRLICLSRQAWLRALPPLWKLPKAELHEEACIARGDDACVYALRWYEATRLGPVLIGLALGALLAWCATRIAALRGLEYLTLPMLGATLGLLWETRRTGRRNLEYGEQSHSALEALGHEYAAAVAEVLELHRRQQDWNELLEDRIAERQAMLDRVLGQVNQMREQRQTTLRTLSHDLRFPIQVVRFSEILLRGHVVPGSEGEVILSDINYALDKMDKLFQELMSFANTDSTLFEVRPERFVLAPLADRMRGTLKALVIQRSIRVSVFATREAPEAIETDLLLFNRVVDNVLTNAAKYTERGSIVVEIGGRPDALCLMISDTGRGIASERLDRVFAGGQPDDSPLIGDSYGLGLSIVVRLLDQIGGRMEIMSKPDVGTTVWIHFPLRVPEPISETRAAGTTPETMDAILRRVVTIKRVANSNG